MFNMYDREHQKLLAKVIGSLGYKDINYLMHLSVTLLTKAGLSSMDVYDNSMELIENLVEEGRSEVESSAMCCMAGIIGLSSIIVEKQSRAVDVERLLNSIKMEEEDDR